MYYNPSRLGQISPYLPVTNNQQNIMQSSAQTEDLYSIHNKITERLLNAVLDFTKYALMINPDEYEYILGDAMLADIAISEDFIASSKLNVFVTNQSEEEQNMQASKELLSYFINSQSIGFEDAIKLIWAKNGSEILNLAQKSDKKKAKQMAQEQQQAMDQQEAMLNAQKEQQQAQHEMELVKIALEQDINQNQMADGTDKELLRIQHEAIENEKERQAKLVIEKMKLETQKYIAQLQEEVKERIAKTQLSRNGYKDKS
jgi:hypothetical protein